MHQSTILPAEWAPQSGTLLTWPHAHSDWRPWLREADRNFVALAEAISRRQRLLIACYDAAHQQHIGELLSASLADLTRIALYQAPSNDSWARDHGPITVYHEGRPVLLKFRFNGWGQKFPYELDDGLAQRLHAAGAFGETPLEAIDLILEGGSIESDGQGTLMTTSQCLLAANRNNLPRQVIEERLRKQLGIERFLWLHEGRLAGDDTDSHIDTLARFCDPETIAYQACEDPQDEHFLPLQAMAAELKAFRSATAKPYRLVPLPLPRTITDASNRCLPASYANFLILNGAVLAPVYGDPADEIAVQRLADCFPNREIIAILCRTLLQQYGSLHCVTMQLPAGVLGEEPSFS